MLGFRNSLLVPGICGTKLKLEAIELRILRFEVRYLKLIIL